MGIANSREFKSRSHTAHRLATVARHHGSLERRGGRVLATRAHDVDDADRGRASAATGLQSGIASVYSGGRTANGEVASANRLTAAHRSLPFGTMVMVTNRGTGRSVVVRINDRGPFVRGRVIDVTPAAAHALGFSGLATVTLSVMGRG
ncbi:MAG TPA: septal ring lytic transglycosylase RlpA family protein [Xanthobacteraceae bacterium]